MAQAMEGYDAIKFSYSTLPSLGDHQLESVALNAKYLIEPGPSLQIAFGGSYRTDRFTYFDLSTFDKTVLDRFHTIEVNAALEKAYGNNWAIGLKVMPRLASNFSSTPSNNDLIYNYGISLKKQWASENQSYSLRLGAERNTYLGAPRYLPVVSFRHQISNKLGYTLGFPRSDFWVKVDDRHQISASASFDGFYYNNSYASFSFEDQVLDDHSKLVYSELAIGLGHKYRLQPRITAHTQIGYSLLNPLELQNGEGTTFFDFEANGTVHFTMGLIYNLKLSSNE